ncbi:Nonribosomal peptide synthetase dtxS1 [Paramyrothecium foliicola]|nr:Nonribosomal peptide synthetase dtxS1 [Paramyrothecium foliicola]
MAHKTTLARYEIEALWDLNQSLPEAIDECVHDTIATRVTQHPEKVAVDAWDGSISYAELDKLSTRLAHQLISYGVGPEVIVPLHFEKSMWTVVAILAVLKAGGAFALVDANLPEDRIKEIVRQCEPKVICTSTSTQKVFAAEDTPILVVGSELPQQRMIQDGSLIPQKSDSKWPMYICFTSGSTGRPKGIVVTHSAFSSARHHQADAFRFHADARVFDFASYAFDVSVYNVIMTLSAGATMCIPSEAQRKGSLNETLRAMRATMVALTPSTSRLLEPTELPDLQTLILSGEAVSEGDLVRFKDAKFTVLNAYGPAECTPMSTLNAFPISTSISTSIGTGIGAVTWVVDPNNHEKLLPRGVPGELLLEGPILARNYLGLPTQTAEVFIESPSWLLQGSSTRSGRSGRLYKTGDVVRTEEDGTLTFLGRKDTQVKIRGQRLELAEVEFHVRAQLPSATVLAEVIEIGGEKERSMLAVFLSGVVELYDTKEIREGLELVDVGEAVKTRIARTLPSYMIPSLYIKIPAIPLSTTGKADRKLLRQLGSSISAQKLVELRGSRANGTQREPQTEAEIHLCQLWASALNVKADNIGLDDEFLQLGGDSLSAIRLVGAARKAGFVLAVEDIFSHPTLSAQVEVQKDRKPVEKQVLTPFSLVANESEIPALKASLTALCNLGNESLVEDAFPCTPLQQGMFMLSTKRRGDYIFQAVLDLHPAVEPQSFISAWEKLSQSVAVFRTRIVQHSELGLLNVVCKDVTEWTQVDSNDLDDYLKNDKATPMDLGDKLVRQALVNDTQGKPHKFIWTMHHSLYDGWSLQLTVKLLEDVLKGRVVAESISETASFANFVQHLRETDDTKSETYWKSYLSEGEISTFPQLPTAMMEPEANTSIEQLLPSRTPPGVTISTLIRGALGLLISQHTGTSDIVFGAVVSGRNAPVVGIEDVLGPTIATVPFRVQFEKEDSISSFLQSLQDSTTEMIPHEQIGLQRLAKMGKQGRNASEFQTLLVVQPEEDEMGSDNTLGQWRTSSTIQGFSTYAIVLECFLNNGGHVKARASFDTRVIDEWRMGKLLKQLATIIERLASAAPASKIGDIKALTMEDEMVVFEWNNSEPAVVEKCVHDIVSQHAKERPYSPAIKAWDGELTHEELDAWSRQLSFKLTELGLGPEAYVPICFEKSMFTIVAILGVLKAGGAFILLDPSLPENRLRYLCAQVGASIAITSPSCQSRLSNIIQDEKTVVLDTEFFKVPRVETIALRKAAPNDPAYIIFTSGSTGEPKGVIIEHRSCSSAAKSHRSMNMNSSMRALQFSSYNFAGCIIEIVMTLIHGGCVCVLSDEERGAQLAESIRRLDANWTFMTSTVLATLRPEDVPCLKTICVGGEPIKRAQIKLWSSKVHLRQTYGSAEQSGVVSSARLLESSTPQDIGKPSRERIWLVDATNVDSLAPLGVPGEIIIEGPVVGREYIGQPQKTAAAMISAPAWRAKYGPIGPVTRFYRTGDLGVYNADGTIRLLGRRDSQVKLRGQRIEVGEVEHQIKLSSSEVQEVVVELVTTLDSTRGPELVGFVRLIGDNTYSDAASAVIRTIQAKLEKVLPYFMVPSLLVPIAKMPLTASGKTDRRGLRELGALISTDNLTQLRAMAAGQKRRARTEAERRLVALWAKALDVDSKDIGVDDSFFRLGGDSIAAMRLVGLARKAGLSLVAADIFRNPTLASQAQVALMLAADSTDEEIASFSLLDQELPVAQLQQSLAALCNVPVESILDAYPCTPIQEGLLSLTAKRSGDYVKQSVLLLRSDIDLEAFQAAWEEVVESLPVLRTRVVQDEHLGLLQVVCQDGIQWLHPQGTLTEYLEEDNSTLMNSGGSLSRYALLTEGETKPKYFVWTIHHALFDGWSLSLIMNRVYKSYQQTGTTVHRPVVGFNSFLKYLLVGLQDVEVESYWQQYLVDGSFALFPALPSSVQEPSTDSISEVKFPFVQTHNTATPSILVRAALGVLLSQYSGSNDVVIGATVSGRNTPVAGVEELIAPTIATVPVRIRVDKETDVTKYLETLQEEATDMIAHEQTGLQRIAKISEDTRNACKFQTLLVVHTGEEEELEGKDILGTWQAAANQESFTTYAVTFECYLAASTITIKASYDSRIVDTWKMDQMLQRFGNLLQRLASAEPSQTIRAVCEVTKSDAVVLSTWNTPSKQLLVEKCIHELIAEHAQQEPSAPAVQAWDGKLTREDLDGLSSQLSHHLVSLGVGAEIVVPICSEKSKWTVVAMLSVLKAGGAFVLLDPGLPDTRIQALCKKVKATVSLTSTACKSRLQSFVETTIAVSSDLFEALPTNKPSLQVSTQPSNAAYIIFTSGSTGEPKGVIIEHQSYCSAAIQHGPRMNMGSDVRALQFGSYNFAGAVMEQLMTLIYGGCVCIPSEEDRGARLAETINKLDANWAFLTSTTLASLSPEIVPSLRTICIGGEPIRAAQIQQWASGPQIMLRQTYGSAETAAVVSSSHIQIASSTSDVGKPTAGIYWIVDPSDHNQLLPIGAPGEVIIEGPTIGRGYLSDPERSAAAFIDAPTWRSQFGPSGKGSRFYKTGDLAAYTRDGSIELLGRKDMQVKLRGQRIETGEIEYHAKLAADSIKQAVVELATVQSSASSNPELVCFLTIETKHGFADYSSFQNEHDRHNIEEATKVIRNTQVWLEGRLPHYMVPSILIPISQIPLTISGKTDRRRLKQIASELSKQELNLLRAATWGQKRSPTTAAEHRLREMWSQVLNLSVAEIGLDDSFFRLGGDSISAMKLVGIAHKEGLDLTVSDIFRQPVLAAQAKNQSNSTVRIQSEIVAPFSLLLDQLREEDLLRDLAGLCGVATDLIEDAYPCTPLQEGLLSLTGKRCGDYMMQAVLELPESMDEDHFKTAWETMVRLTPMFRTHIVQHSSLGLVQVVCRETIEWEHATNLEDYLQKDKSLPMGLGDRLSRFCLIASGLKATRSLVWSVHHATYDGWSFPLSVELAAKAYEGLPLGDQIGFNAFVKQVLGVNRLEAENFWRKQMSEPEFAPFPTLPTSNHAPRANDMVETSFPLPVKTELTTSTLLRGALAIIISQYTSSTDVIFGVTVSGRNAPVEGIEKIIGPTIATVPVRIQTPTKLPVPEYLHQIQQQSTDMMAYEQTGLHKIARIDENCRSGVSFQTLLAVQPEGAPLQDGALGIWRTALDQEGFVTYALAVECILGADQVVVKAGFDSEVISKWQAKQLLHQLGVAVEQLATKSTATDQMLGSIYPVSVEDEKTIWSWNKDIPNAVEHCVHDLVHSHAQANPSAPAICSSEGELSYGELDALSTRLASYIANHKVMSSGSETTIPLYFEKSIWTIVAIQAVLKAGAAFVLVDPSLPAARRDYMIQETGNSSLIIASPQTAEEIAVRGREVFQVSADHLAALPEDAGFTTRANPDSPAYIMFTSGSTGQPKGVVITHRAASTGCSGHGGVADFDNSIRVLQFSSYAFDACIVELITTLIFGGCICVPQDRHSDINESINNMAVNTVVLVPSVARTLHPDSVAKLDKLVLCGEKPTEKDIEMFSPVQVALNAYGPAECTICCSVSTMDTNLESRCIGQAVGSVTWVVSAEDHNRLVPIGAIGELLVEGHILARGYLKNPQKTAEVFVEDPEWLIRGTAGQPGRRGRLYKTGDLVRYEEDGRMIFIGRKDSQAKIRGQRLELAEVEHHIREALGPNTNVAAEIITLKNESGKPLLAAYIANGSLPIARKSGGEALHQLCQVSEDTYLARPDAEFELELQQRLPSYMVPTVYFHLQSIPQTASGKTSSRRLRTIGSALSAEDLAKQRTASNGNKRQPSTDKEKLIRDVWARVLNLPAPNIGLDDNFIQLGGDSVTAMMVVGEARKLGLDFGVSDVLHKPRLHHLADAALLASSNIPEDIPRTQVQGPVEQSYAQSRLWFLDQLYPNSTQYLMPYAMRIRGPLNLPALRAALLALEDRHETLRTTFTTENDIELQIVQPLEPRELNIIDISEGDEVAFEKALQVEQNTPFDLRKETSWRITIYRFSREYHVLSIVMHHIINDGWSSSILQRELSIFYSAALHGEDPLSRIKPLPISYRDYAVWQKQQEQVDHYQKQLVYWTTQLENSQPAELFCDYQRPATLSGQAAIQTITIDGSLYDRLQSFCREREVTPFVALLAAFRATHYRLTGSEDATIGTANANRDKWQLRDVIGFFVNLQCLRLKTNEDQTFEELVQQVQATNKASLENPDVPFEQVVAELKKRQNRDISRQPLVQMVFTLHSQKDLGHFKFEGVETEQLHAELSSRFDLEFHVAQEENCFRGEVAYSTELFDPNTISSMLSVFQTILELGLETPSEPIGFMDLATDKGISTLEEHGLLKVQQTTYPRESSIVDVFAKQVATFPNRIAVKDAAGQLTYAELDRRSDDVSLWLRSQSLPGEQLVAVYSTRSSWTIIAYFGILKANMAYLPLDTKTPEARVEDILSRINGQKVVLLGPGVNAPSLQLENVKYMSVEDIQPQDSTNLPSITTPSANSLAYVLFTSGSTGKPKGVMIEHRGVLRLVTENNIVQHLPSAPVMAHVGNISFDITTWEIYAALLNGGTVVCIDNMTVLDTKALARVFLREMINTTIITPVLLKHCLAESPAMLAQLQLLVVGGDKADGRDLSLAQQITKRKVVNAYGPTENSVMSTFYCLQDAEVLNDGVPIGRAISNSGAYVVDRQMRLVPLGVIGELLVTGDGLARGYTDASLNENRFVSAVIGGDEVRAYRTGDYVRYRPATAQLEFFGRIDGQVKVQGNRVELGEIEIVLQKDDAVRDAVVIAQGKEGQTRLVGFVTVAEDDGSEEDGAEEEGDSNEAEHVELWETLFDSDKYLGFEDIQKDSIGRDFTSWTSMYSGKLIETEEMNEWLDDTIREIRNGSSPRNVLEIGTGTGMMLFNLTDGLESYVGLEPTEKAISFVYQASTLIPGLSDKLYLQKGTATDIGNLKKLNNPNLVVINSVAQYFPRQEYLFKVIEQLIQLDGVETIHFGDMRSYALYKEFQATKALHNLGLDASKDEIRQHMRTTARAEQELLVEPGFFTALPQLFPGLIDHVEIVPKKMNAINELSCYRYAAVLHISKNVPKREVHHIANDEWIDFHGSRLDAKTLLQLLKDRSAISQHVAISNIPYKYTIAERCIVDAMEKGTEMTIASLVAKSQDWHALSPNDLEHFAAQAGYRVDISWARQHSQRGGFDAVFHHYQSQPEGSRVLFNFPTDHEGRKYHALSSRPLQQRYRQRIEYRLLESLRNQLPTYMRPQAIIILDELPVNQNGKVDRKALTEGAPKLAQATEEQNYQPTSQTERDLQRIWSEVLYLNPAVIGPNDSFFILGGDSIAAMKAVSQARRIGISIAVADIFRNPTLAAQAEVCDKQAAKNAQGSSMKEIIGDLKPFALLETEHSPEYLRREFATLANVNAAEVEDAYPCTPLQEGLLSLTAKRDGSYVRQVYLELSKTIDTRAFVAAWDQVQQATAILRTKIVQHPQLGLTQVVCQEGINWVRSTNLQDHLDQDNAIPMGLGDNLARYGLVEGQPDQPRYFVWTMHHALYDGWSHGLILELVGQAYHGQTATTQPPGFNTFVQSVISNDDESTDTYWRKYLQGGDFVTFPSLPPSVQEPLADDTISFIIPTRAKKEFTMATLLRGALALVMSQFQSSSDVVFGAVLSGRNAPVDGIEHIVGPTIATVPVRVKVPLEQDVQEFLQSVGQDATEMIEYEQTGLQRIAKVDENGRAACDFQTLLAVQPSADNEDNSTDSFGTWHGAGKEGAFSTYAVTIQCLLGREETTIRADFDSQVMDRWLMERFLRHFSTVVRHLAESPSESELSKLESFTSYEKNMLWKWNETQPVMDASSPLASIVGKADGERFWIVNPDNHNQLALIGAPGEIIVETNTIDVDSAAGSGRLAQSFVPIPSWRADFDQYDTGAQFYKTGYLAKLKSDGTLEKIGKKELQVKLGGKRVDIDQIEQRARTASPDVAELAVELIAASEDGSRRPQLIGFLALKKDGNEADIVANKHILAAFDKRTTAAIQAVRARLEETLPQQMVPSVFVPLHTLPRTTGGELSRAGLKEIGKDLTTEQLTQLRALLTEGITRKAPTTDAARQLQQLWSRVLNINPNSIGLDDNFFRLGGDSITAMKLVVEARKFGVELAVADIFRHGTLGALANYQNIQDKLTDAELEQIVLVEPTTRQALFKEIDALGIDIDSSAVEDILPLTTFQKNCVVSGVDECGQFCQYVWLDVGPTLDIARFEESYTAVLKKFPILRARFLPLLGTYYQVIQRDMQLSLQTITVDGELDEACKAFCHEDNRTFDVTASPFAITLLQNKTEGVRLLLRISHAQYDGFSLPAIFQALIAGYKGMDFFDRPDFSKFLSYSAVRKEKSIIYWQGLLDGSSLTNFRAKLPQQLIASDAVPVLLSAERETKLPRLTGNVTHASLASACWALLLAQMTGQKDVTYTYLGAGRNSALQGVEDVIGPCVNFIPVRVDLSSCSSPTELLELVQEQSLSLGEADSLDFGDIAKHCTNWPAGTELDSVIQYQNIDEHPTFRFEDTDSKIQFFENADLVPPSTPSMHVIFHPVADRLKIRLSSSSHVMDKTTANAILENLCVIIDQMGERKETS